MFLPRISGISVKFDEGHLLLTVMQPSEITFRIYDQTEIVIVNECSER